MADLPLYGRTWRLVAGQAGTLAIEVQQLRVVFKVERAHSPDANGASIQVYNLNRSSRDLLADDDTVAQLEAGYGTARPQIFKGRISKTTTKRNGSDRVTTLETEDGADQLAKARVSASFAAGARLADVFNTVKDDLGVGVGNAIEAFNEGNFTRALTQFSQGIVLRGNGREMIDRLTKAAGLEWSIQDEQLVITKPGEPLPGEAVVLSEGTGLVGSPEAGEKGIVRARALIQPGLDPARRVKIESDEIDGFYRVVRSTYTGDSHGPDWYCDLEVRPL